MNSPGDGVAQKGINRASGTSNAPSTCLIKMQVRPQPVLSSGGPVEISIANVSVAAAMDPRPTHVGLRRQDKSEGDSEKVAGAQ